MAVPARLGWVDAARGLAISLVVLLHSAQWLADAGLVSPGWAVFGALATGIRIPLFFLVSGLLAGRRVREGWRALVTDRLLLLIWVYLLWQVVGSASAVVAAQFTGDRLSAPRMAASLLVAVLRPRFELWFIWALVCFLVLARLTRRVPVAVQLGSATVASVVFLSGLVPEVNLGWNGVPRFYLFFLIGLHQRELLLWLADSLTRLRAGLLVVGWASLAGAALLADAGDVVGVGTVIRLAGLLAGVALATRLAWCGPLRRLGAQTLPVYLAHNPLIVLAAWGLASLHAALGDRWWLAPGLLVPVVAVGAGLGSVALHRLLAAGPLYWLYREPAWLASLFTPHPTPKHAHRSPARALAGTPCVITPHSSA